MAFNNYVKTIAAGASSDSDILVREATTTDVIIGLNIANTHATATATVKVELGTTSLLENAKIPSGGAIEVIQGKIVIKDNDKINVTPTGAGVDVVMSVLESA
tara:strand:+ start:2967 stop:3275 length:309 start_codon:yes stop_codon:yes gene_type:complete